MPVFETVGGGTPHHHHHHHHHHDGAQHGGLNSFERAAAQQALAKLTGSSGFTPSAQPTPAGGSFHFSPIKTLSQGLVAGKGTVRATDEVELIYQTEPWGKPAELRLHQKSRSTARCTDWSPGSRPS